jgi:hypothetical protein
VHLVELADHRRRFRLAPADVAFNLRVTPDGLYNTDTAAGTTTPRTWQEVLDRIWAKFPAAYAGTSPTLPATPDASPEGFDFYGWRAADAYQYVLHRLGLDLAWDPFNDLFSLVQPGGTQAGLADAENGAMLVRLFDVEPVAANFGQLPAQIKVYFRKQSAGPGPVYGDSPFITKTVSDPSGTLGGQEGVEVVFDDLPALFSGCDRSFGVNRTPDNDAALTARATARASRVVPHPPRLPGRRVPQGVQRVPEHLPSRRPGAVGRLAGSRRRAGRGRADHRG